MSTLATQAYNKIISTLDPEEKEKFDKDWIRKTKYTTNTQWHTEWYCNPMKMTFSLLHAPTMDDVIAQPDIKHTLEAMSFFEDQTVARYVHMYHKNMIAYNSLLLEHLLCYIPGKDMWEKASTMGTMFIGGILGDKMLLGVYVKSDNIWLYKNELSIIRITSNQKNTSNKKVLTCSADYCDISNDCNEGRYMPTLIYYGNGE